MVHNNPLSHAEVEIIDIINVYVKSDSGKNTLAARAARVIPASHLTTRLRIADNASAIAVASVSGFVPSALTTIFAPSTVTDTVGLEPFPLSFGIDSLLSPRDEEIAKRIQNVTILQ